MNNHSKEYKNIRIFHDLDAQDFEYTLYGIDSENYLVNIRAIYNQTTNSKMYLVDWLEEYGVNIENLNFEEYLGKNSPSDEIPQEAKPHEIEFISKLNLATIKSENNLFEKAHNYCSTNSTIELKKENYLFDKNLGLFLKDDYNSFVTKQFNKELGSLITLDIVGINDVTQLRSEYEKFKNLIWDIRDDIVKKLFKLYTIYKDDVYEGESKEFLESVCPVLNKPRDVLKLIEYKSLTIIIRDQATEFILHGEATWDIEHGFRITISENGQITIE